MLRSDFGSALVSGAQKSGALELVGEIGIKFTIIDFPNFDKQFESWRPFKLDFRIEKSFFSPKIKFNSTRKNANIQIIV
jgi:hypothetical protein